MSKYQKQRGYSPAFPVAEQFAHSGLTKREEIAARILAALCVNADGNCKQILQEYPNMAVHMTDALLERTEGQKEDLPKNFKVK